MTHKFNISKPKFIRKGQQIFNFLEWLRVKGYQTNQAPRMADPFFISDEDFDILYTKFCEEQNSGAH